MDPPSVRWSVRHSVMSVRQSVSSSVRPSEFGLLFSTVPGFRVFFLCQCDAFFIAYSDLFYIIDLLCKVPYYSTNWTLIILYKIYRHIITLCYEVYVGLWFLMSYSFQFPTEIKYLFSIYFGRELCCNFSSNPL